MTLIKQTPSNHYSNRKRKKFPNALARKLFEYRIEKDWSQDTFAYKLDISFTTYFRLEKKGHTPNHVIAEKIAKFFNQTTKTILSFALIPDQDLP